MSSTATRARPEPAEEPGEGPEPPFRPVVLFVDDEPEVLAGLRATLHRQRHRYHFRFVAGVDEALDVLGREPVHVVVADLHLQGRGGPELLAVIRDRHPEVIRYILSGEVSSHLVMRAMPMSHRWLVKPCDRDVLIEALADATRYLRLHLDPTIGAAVGGTDALPSPPTLYARIADLMADDDVTVGQVAEVAETDAAIAAKLLQLANSAFASGQPVVDIKGAVTRIGIEAVAELVLSEEVLRCLKPVESIPGLSEHLLTELPLATSTASGVLAAPEAAATARVAGVLANVGLLLEASRAPARLAEAYARAEADGTSLLVAEEELFGVTHPQLAGHLLSIWGLPTDLVLAVVGAHQFPDPKLPTPMGAPDAVRAGRLVAFSHLAGPNVGRPHTRPISPELAVSLTTWTRSVGLEP